jgi:hypothetical protein
MSTKSYTKTRFSANDVALAPPGKRTEPATVRGRQ